MKWPFKLRHVRFTGPVNHQAERPSRRRRERWLAAPQQVTPDWTDVTHAAVTHLKHLCCVDISAFQTWRSAHKVTFIKGQSDCQQRLFCPTITTTFDPIGPALRNYSCQRVRSSDWWVTALPRIPVDQHVMMIPSSGRRLLGFVTLLLLLSPTSYSNVCT